MATWRPVLLLPFAALLWASGAQAQQVSRIIDAIDLTERGGDHIDVVVQFSCSMRYIAHTPATQGAELRLRLRAGADCGTAAGLGGGSELAPLPDNDGILTSARLDTGAPGEFTLTLGFAQPESFVVAPGTNLRGLRVRILRRSTRTGRVTVVPPTDVLANFAINLESRLEPFPDEQVALASERLGLPAFVSTVELDGQRWYRLRVGPLDRRSVAEQALRTAAPLYPRAWIAIGDDALTSDPAITPATAAPRIESIGADPPLDAAQRKRLFDDARRAMIARDHTRAILLLTRLQRQPEFAERATAQELLALARERSGQLAHAKAEYEEYLLRYPQGASAERVRMRLRILRAASADGKSAGAAGETDRSWRLAGTFSQIYRHDVSQIEESGESFESLNQKAIFNDAAFTARKRNERIDLASRLTLGYAHNLLPNGPGDQVRVSTAYFEMNDRVRGWGARLGRQSHSSSAALGPFDGLAVSYQLRPSWSLQALTGLPVESSRDGPDTGRQFAALSVGVEPASHWSARAFLARQRDEGLTARQAAGLELNYFVPGRSIVGWVDYDLEFHALNAAVLVGTLVLPARWTVSFDFERRNSPVLTTRNALIGQPVDTLTALLGTFSVEEIDQLARDRTAQLSSYSVSAGRPLGERFHITADVFASQLSATQASGGVAAQPQTGLDLAWQAQFFATSLMRRGDFNVLALRYENTERARLASASLTSRLPLAGAWRIGPRLRFEQRRLAATDTTEQLYVPALRVDYQRDRKLFELEVGAEIGQSSRVASDDTRRYFLGVGYRIGL